MTITKISTLKNQAAFDLANKVGKKNNGRFFILVSHKPASEIQSQKVIYLGLKVSKKMGNAIVRNKIRRRIKHMFRNISKKLPEEKWLGRVFVLIPRKGFDKGVFSELEKDLIWNVKKITSQAEESNQSTA
jgi:ribonuclease P protein component